MGCKSTMLLAGAVALVVVVIQIPSVYCGKARLIPSDRTKLDEWIAVNMKDYVERKAKQGNSSLDIKLAKAEDSVKIVKVRKDSTGDFNTVTDAVKSIPKGNTQRVVVWIGGGEYVEKITVDVSKPFLTFYGDKDDMPTIVFDGTAFQYGTLNSATVEIESDYFVAANIWIQNSAPMPDGKRMGAQAVAMRISGDKAAFHNCRFIGFQDTLCDDKGRHFFRDCHIQGTVDFIFGNGKSLYLNTSIISVAKGMGVITAQAREDVSDDSGFTFVHCNITGTGDTYLGRAWKECPRVVFAYTFMGTLINSQGWSNNMHKDRNETTVYYGEYKCEGPGASTKGRVNYAKTLSDEEAQPFLSMTYLHGNKWILPPPKL
ncbi:putative pectinesterase 63 [Ziziphus jujuba]|uniref:Pectinesterase n=1 Tax=Ziziphus jujuba TaxID=326968 RepID=A0ABM3IUP5_ZIZJJ|nr:putative pectinesterase 63 [Ziziphus jujuba]